MRINCSLSDHKYALLVSNDDVITVTVYTSGTVASQVLAEFSLTRMDAYKLSTELERIANDQEGKTDVIQ